MNVKLRRGLEALEEMPGNFLERIQSGQTPPKDRVCFLVSMCLRNGDLGKSTCERTLNEHCVVLEIVHLKNVKGEAASHEGSEEELNRRIVTFPIEPVEAGEKSSLGHTYR
jgi:hypothetical protein